MNKVETKKGSGCLNNQLIISNTGDTSKSIRNSNNEQNQVYADVWVNVYDYSASKRFIYKPQRQRANRRFP